MRALAFLLIAPILGCAHTVQVEMAAQPSVALGTHTIAVVTGDRACREVADALVRELNAIDGLEVTPHSEVRLEVFGCEQPVAPVTIDVELGDELDRRKVSVEGRAHAVVAVKVGEVTRAHLIGAARQDVRGNGVEKSVLALSRAVDRELTQAVAEDLAKQLSPAPRVVDRRIYPRAATGSALALHTLAVDAERTGRIAEARRLAQAAYDESPTERHRAYVEELDAILDRWPSPPLETAAIR